VVSSLSVGRNEPCPCGSGKKYKKCCLKKESLVSFEQTQKQRYAETMQGLTKKMLKGFLYKETSLEERQLVLQQLKDKSKDVFTYQELQANFDFMFSFFHMFENGYRGVEWFYQQGKDLTEYERELLANWTSMFPRLLKVKEVYVEQKGGITVQDVITGEDFIITYPDQSDSITLEQAFLGLVEPNWKGYTLHGFMIPVYKEEEEQMVSKINNWIADKDKSYSEVMLAHYLELFTDSTAGGENSSAFYQIDIDEFVKERTEGKSEVTIKKYTEGMDILSNYLAVTHAKGTDSWEQYDENYWEGYISALLDNNEDSMTKKKANISVIKAFIKWLDQKYDSNYHLIVDELINEVMLVKA